MKVRKAFTLIELLVVIAIIALLLSILLPGLKKAKIVARRTICVSDLHALTACWQAYATDNDEVMAAAKTTPLRLVSAATLTFEWDFNLWASSGLTAPTWAGLYPILNYPLRAPRSDPTEIAGRKAALTMGTFFPYNENVEIYRCPFAPKELIRSYSTVDSLNGFAYTSYDSKWVPIQKTTQIRSSTVQIVFICEDDPSLGQGWSVSPSNSQGWFDNIPTRHDGVACSYADGHSEWWKYEDRRTLEYAQKWKNDIYNPARPSGPANPLSNPVNPDFLRLRRGIWGQIN